MAGRRPDGYHEVATRMQSVSLHDLLLAQVGSTGLTVEGHGVSPEGNLVLRAHAALEAAEGRRLPVSFRLLKRIPPGAGLGGGSSDAAAALRAIAALHGTRTDLGSVAPALGADVPFFLGGGGALASGRGDQVTPAESVPGWWAIAWPGFALSTPAVYGAWDATGGSPPNELDRAARQVEPRLDAFAQRLGPGWQLTGSGSAFFHPAGSRSEAEGLAARLDCWTAVAHSVPAWA